MRERDRPAHARVGAVVGQHVADRVAGGPGGGIDVGDRAADARLDELEPHRPLRRGEDDLVEMILAVGVEAAEDEVGAEAGERDRRLAGAGETPVHFVDRRGRGDQEREAVLEGIGGLDGTRPLAIGVARRLGIEARQPERAAEEIAEPLRAQGAHVVGGDAVAPDLDLGALLDPIDGDVHGEHAGRAQDQLARLQRRLHERHARQLALRHEHAGGVDDQPLAIEIEAGLGQHGLARRAAGARFDGVDVDRFERHVEVGGDGGSPRWNAPPQRRRSGDCLRSAPYNRRDAALRRAGERRRDRRQEPGAVARAPRSLGGVARRAGLGGARGRPCLRAQRRLGRPAAAPQGLGQPRRRRDDAGPRHGRARRCVVGPPRVLGLGAARRHARRHHRCRRARARARHRARASRRT